MIVVSKNMNPVPVISVPERPLAVVSKNMNPLQVVSRPLRRDSYTTVSIPMHIIYDPAANQYVFVDENGNPFISEDNQNKFKPE